jgi:hypothetical protein
LKKQSQFVTAQIDIKSYMKGYYDKIPLCGAQKNKANPPGLSMPTRNRRTSQSQYYLAPRPVLGVEKAI